MNQKEKAKMIKQKISLLFYALKHKDTPIIVKLLAGITVVYALSPIDFIPDFVPILGYLDDIIILPLLITFCIKFIPKNVIYDCEKKIAESEWNARKQKKWYYAIPIILIWILIILIMISKFIF